MNEKVKEQVIDSKRLFYFSEVFKRGSINAVADRLDMSQAGIGRQIQLLERELGMLLFERGTNGRGMAPGGHGKGMVPTEAAQLVYDFYCHYRDQQDKLMVALEELRQMKRGNIRIAILSSYIEAFMEEVLNDFYHKHPDLNIDICEIGSTPQVINQVLRDDAHIGMIHGSLDNPDIRYYAHGKAPICLLMSKHHPFFSKQKVDFPEIVSYRTVLPTGSYNIWKVIRSIEGFEKIQMTLPLTIDSFTARKKLAIAGHGGALMSAFAARQELKTGQLAMCEIDHPALTSLEASLIVRRGRLLSPAANQLLRLIAAKFSLFSHNSPNPISNQTPVRPSLAPQTGTVSLSPKR